ncbi:MAG: hypothetical protein KIT10_07730 [Flavobacteriales bacterium]|nr:hypothetical protein [Flavobacteriales bacterium]
MRRLPAVILLLALIGVATWTLWTWERGTQQGADPWRAVPERAALVIVVPDAMRTWDRFTHTSQLWSAFERMPSAAAVGRGMARTWARMEADAGLRDALQGQEALVAIMRQGGGKLGILFILAMDEKGLGASRAMQESLGMDATSWAALLKGATTLARPDTALAPCGAHLLEGLLLLASDGETLDEALAQWRAPASITAQPALAQALSTLGADADAHVVVHTTRAVRLLHDVWRPDALEHLDAPPGWAALDLRARADAFLLSGLLVPEGEHAMLAAMRTQGTGRPAPWRSLPAETQVLETQWISDPMRWVRERWNADEDAEALLGWVRGPMAIATSVQDGVETRWFWFGTDDPIRASEDLDGLCGTACDTMGYRGVRIAQLPLTAHERLLGRAYADLEKPWWTVLGDAVILAARPDPLRRAIDVWLDGGALSEDARHNAWAARVGQESGHAWWMDVARGRTLLRDGLTKDAADSFDGLDSVWSRLGGISLQLSPGQRGYHHVFAGLGHAPLKEAATGALWSTPIGKPVERAPDILRNHVNGTREVLVQDTGHSIHLLGSNGKVLWSRALDGVIMGDVHQVDRFRNGKLQMLLNTANSVYLIDRNGKDVGGWPVKLKHPATAPLAVFDYDGTHEYRIMLPIADGTMMNLGPDGEMVKGWEPPKMAAPVGMTPRHLRIRNKDHVVVADASGKVWVLDRRGSEREKVEQRIDAGATVLGLSPGLDIRSSTMLWHDAAGRLWQGTLSGERKPLHDGPGMAWPMEGGSSIARIHADTLTIIVDGREAMSRNLGHVLLPEPGMVDLGPGRRWLAITLPDAGQVTLLDELGREPGGFPLQGHVPLRIADLDLDGQPEAITVTRDGMVTAHRAPGLSKP